MNLTKDMNKEERKRKIKYELECLVENWDSISFQEQKRILCSLSWKIRLIGVDEKKMSEKNSKNRLSKILIKGLADNTNKN